ncbi:hypothetical protein OSCI_780025 [Kamptonema sp. PCC 6506]|nr:hypothetical protein OSCI_780025 [Kamptonema sp. PCC 6506]
MDDNSDPWYYQIQFVLPFPDSPYPAIAPTSPLAFQFIKSGLLQLPS